MHCICYILACFRKQYKLYNWYILTNHSQFKKYIIQWRHNDRDGVSIHRRLDSLLNQLFRRK